MTVIGKNKYDQELTWHLPNNKTLTLNIKAEALEKCEKTDDGYIIPWNDTEKTLAVRAADLTSSDFQLYDKLWESYARWKDCTDPNKLKYHQKRRIQKDGTDRAVTAIGVYESVLNSAVYESGFRPNRVFAKSRTFPLAYFGCIVKWALRCKDALGFDGVYTATDRAKAINDELLYWAKVFESKTIRVYEPVRALINRTIQQPELPFAEGTTLQQLTKERNEKIVVPAPNVTDIMLRPHERQLLQITGSATLSFRMPFRIARPYLVYYCAQLADELATHGAYAVAPNGNEVLLVCDIHQLCYSNPLLDKEYPKDSSHDQTYEAVRKVEELVDATYIKILEMHKQCQESEVADAADAE